MTWEDVADGLVGYAVTMSVFTPALAILSGMLGGVDAVVGAGFAVSSLLYWEFYRAARDDV